MSDATQVWIVTGGAGCGKSAVRSIAAHVAIQAGQSVGEFDADQAVSDLLDDGDTLDRIVQELGPEARAADGDANRSWIRERIFTDPAARERLEGILHPSVFRACSVSLAAARDRGDAAFIAEIPLHFEAGERSLSDGAARTLVVAASRSLRIKRIAQRPGMDADSARRLIALQMPLQEKISAADIVIWNDGHRDNLSYQARLLAASFTSPPKRKHERL